MNESMIGHESPVNRLAAKLFWKSPWWAKLPEEDPPRVPQNPYSPWKQQQPLNHKGRLIYWPNGNEHFGALVGKNYLVTGCADVTGSQGNRKYNWWVLIEGEFVRVPGSSMPCRKERFGSGSLYLVNGRKPKFPQ